MSKGKRRTNICLFLYNKGQTFATIPCKNGTLKQLMSGWIKEKSMIKDEVEKNGTNQKTQRMRSAASEEIDKGCYKYFLNTHYQNPLW